MVGQFTADDPDGDVLEFTLVPGIGDHENSSFIMKPNGTLESNVIFDFETHREDHRIRVQVSDVHGSSMVSEFVVKLINMPDDPQITLAQTTFSHPAKSLQDWEENATIAKLSVDNQSGITFELLPDSSQSMHLFILEEDGSLSLAEPARPGDAKNHTLRVQILKDGQPVNITSITVNLTVPPLEAFHDSNTSDPGYHESKLMIRDLEVVQDPTRTGHNPITGFVKDGDNIKVTTTKPHKRKTGDSVVLSGLDEFTVAGKDGKNSKRNWNFLIEKVDDKSFFLRHFKISFKTIKVGDKEIEEPRYTGEIDPEPVVISADLDSAEATDAQLSDAFLLGEWTFGHLLGNMVSEEDDPVEFYKHFADQWSKVQTVNDWDSDERSCW